MDTNLGRLQGAGDGEGGLACRSPWARKESDTTEGLNNCRAQRLAPAVITAVDPHGCFLFVSHWILKTSDPAQLHSFLLELGLPWR